MVQLIAARYEVTGQLASGGMGSVCRVVDRRTGTEMALKRALLEGVDRDFVIESFQREFQVLAGLEHPRIIRVYDYGVDAEGPYYTMELVPGADARSAAPLPWRQACSCLRDIATSLSLLHVRRLLHRDLSPSNVRIMPDGHCKLLDFGALTTFGRSRFIVGTPSVVPPEALEDASLDQRADLFALGALGYYMIAGRHAYPAQMLSELPLVWNQVVEPPSAFASDVPADLDALILSMLSTHPVARPASAAEVIVRLGAIAELRDEEGGDLERLAQSFLASPRFVGRGSELQSLESRVDEARAGRGGAVLVTGASGMGRTRLLEEIGVRAQVAGFTVLNADASNVLQPYGTAEALAMHLLDALPDTSADDPAFGSAGDIAGWFAEVSRRRPLIVLVDNVDSSDAPSLGLLAELATMAPQIPLLVIVTERPGAAPRRPMGLDALRARSVSVPLVPFDRDETLQLVHSLFGEVPQVGRFAQWLHGRTDGCPLHCVEIARQLVKRGVIRYVGGTWVLPVERPDTALPSALGEALAARIGGLGEEARGLAECLSLSRELPPLDLCHRLVDGPDDGHVHAVLDELARNDVVHFDSGEIRFSSAGLRDVILASMDDDQRGRHHRRLGDVLASLAGPDDGVRRLEAGWHLLRGGDEGRGAEMIAEVTHDTAAIGKMVANLHPSGEPIEAALRVFKRQGRSKIEQMPLLAALAFAGYYEARVWGERYGDEAIETARELSGLRLARRLRPILGRAGSLVVALGIAASRFYLAPRRERRYSFKELLVELFSSVITLTGAAVVMLDVDRARRIADVLEPFFVRPKRLVTFGIYKMCVGLCKIAGDRPAAARATFDWLAERFANPRHYILLDADSRLLTHSGVTFAKAACAVMHEDGSEALEAADALDGTGLQLYRMIASELRYLYYMNRGEVAKAAPHREQVDVHAAHVGSAWQVEAWEPAALIPVSSQIGDVIALTRIEEQLAASSRATPSLERYRRMARAARMVFSQDRVGNARVRSVLAESEDELRAHEPRDFIGWAAMHGLVARGYNSFGEHARAEDVCLHALEHMTEGDRAYTTLTLAVEIELALARAGLGRVDEALDEIEALIARSRGLDHPLVQGLLHEARARIGFGAGREVVFAESLAAMQRWLRPTGTPALVMRCNQLAALGGSEQIKRTSSYPPERPVPDGDAVVTRPDQEGVSPHETTIADVEENTVAIRRRG